MFKNFGATFGYAFGLTFGLMTGALAACELTSAIKKLKAGKEEGEETAEQHDFVT